MRARHAQGEIADALLGHPAAVVTPQVEARATGFRRHAARCPVKRGEATGDRISRQTLLNAVEGRTGLIKRLGSRIITTQHQTVGAADLGGELAKSGVERFGGGIGVGVIPLDIGNHRDRRGEGQKDAVVFISLDDERRSGVAPSGIPAQVGYLRANQVASSNPGAAQSHGEHRARGRFAVGARHRKHLALLRPLAPEVGAAADGDARLTRRHHFQVVVRHRSGRHHRLSARDIGGAVPLVDRGSTGGEGGGQPVRRRV